MHDLVDDFVYLRAKRIRKQEVLMWCDVRTQMVKSLVQGNF